MQPNVSPFTLNFVKGFEGYTPKPKWDHKQYSVGYGTRWQPGQPVGSRQDHESALAKHLSGVGSYLDQNLKVDITPQQRTALKSFGFNLGEGNLANILENVNAGDIEGAANRMMKYINASGQPLPGLEKRRRAEAALMLGSPLQQAMASQAAIGAPQGDVGGGPAPAPMQTLNPPSGRNSKLGEALLISAARANPTNWGQLLNATGDLVLGSSLTDDADQSQNQYRSQLAQSLLGADTPQAMSDALIASGDPAMMKAGVSARMKAAQPQRGASFSKTPVYGTDAQGNPVLIQLNDRGQAVQTQLPEGVNLSTGVDRVDLGTRWGLIDKRSGQLVGAVDKEIREAEREKQIGAGEGKRITERPEKFKAAQNALASLEQKRDTVVSSIDQAIQMIESGAIPLTGIFSAASAIPGTPQYDLARVLDPIKANLGFEELNAMREASPTGGALGQVTERELAFLQAVQGSIDQGQSAGQLLNNLKKIRQRFNQNSQRRQQAFERDFGGQLNQTDSAPQPAQGQPQRLRFNPQTGEFE